MDRPEQRVRRARRGFNDGPVSRRGHGHACASTKSSGKCTSGYSPVKYLTASKYTSICVHRVMYTSGDLRSSAIALLEFQKVYTYIKIKIYHEFQDFHT